MNIDDIYKCIQDYLNDPPLIIWGSGATIGFGLPSMSKLKEEIGKSVSSFDKTCTDLEAELGKEKYEPILPEIRKVIRDVVNEADINAKKLLLTSGDDFEGILRLTRFCYGPHPKVMNVVSTNYDRILEYVWGYYGFHFTDGFDQHELSVFDEDNFKDKEIINLMKVHGSLNWFDVDHEIRKLTTDFGYDPVMIPPGKNKYRTTHHSPYRELMQKSDNAIKKASSFLVVGFGFNDEHITPLVSKKTKTGTPIVVVTMKVTATTERELEKAKKVIYVEADADIAKSHIRIIENGSVKSDSIIDGDYWKLNTFMEILQ
ncbi:MAG: SIR2 family protein [Bacteroidales bacterium]|nr:SIR2 family protein [Bacteroidales bacterium]